ncbi:hypothetical protein [Helicobacter sp.]|uniref:hypothetical protein n=1 Tax=Helicobacter sp. TaxID=218 RepID=UPI0025BFB453|nr:hypothetical protein [Helicobacter sp.]MCI5632137.1 hypothetical protein [Helicobacter sp.]MDY5557163.1 hypothetical protein [Helicobacter sp.]
MSTENLLRALDDEYRAYCFYTLASPLDEMFVHLQSAELSHINALKFHLQKLNVAIPENPYANTLTLPASLEEVIQTAIMRENENVALYNTLLANEQNPEIIDTFYRLQAASFNQHIPALQNALIRVQNPIAQNPKNMQNTMEILNNGKDVLKETGAMIAQLKEGTLKQEQLESFLGRLNYSLIGGVIIGALGVAVFNEFLNQNKE